MIRLGFESIIHECMPPYSLSQPIHELQNLALRISDNLTWDLNVVDPWFNFRATKYLVENGFYSFWDWFDDRKH